LYSENIPGFENVAALDQIPSVGSYVVALPMKIARGSGGPLRIVAFVPGDLARP
jgi:kynurenine formamidase